MSRRLFSIPPQSYGCKPVDEVIRRRRTGGACNLKCYGRKPVEIYFKNLNRIIYMPAGQKAIHNLLFASAVVRGDFAAV